MRKISKLLMLLIVCSVWLACETKTPTPPTNAPASPSPAGTAPTNGATTGDSEAKNLYVKNCGSCHGENGVPTVEALKATNLTDAGLQEKWTEDRLKEIITKGSGRMSAVRGLSPEETTKVAQYVKTLKK